MPSQTNCFKELLMMFGISVFCCHHSQKGTNEIHITNGHFPHPSVISYQHLTTEISVLETLFPVDLYDSIFFRFSFYSFFLSLLC